MEVEHIVPRSGGGGNKVRNLPLSCRPCNEKTDNQTTAEFGYPEVQAKAKRSLRDAAAGKDLT